MQKLFLKSIATLALGIAFQSWGDCIEQPVILELPDNKQLLPHGAKLKVKSDRIEITSSDGTDSLEWQERDGKMLIVAKNADGEQEIVDKNFEVTLRDSEMRDKLKIKIEKQQDGTFFVQLNPFSEEGKELIYPHLTFRHSKSETKKNGSVESSRYRMHVNASEDQTSNSMLTVNHNIERDSKKEIDRQLTHTFESREVAYKDSCAGRIEKSGAKVRGDFGSTQGEYSKKPQGTATAR